MKAEQENTRQPELSRQVLVTGGSFESLAAACEIADLGFPVLLSYQKEPPFSSPAADLAAKNGGKKTIDDIRKRARKAGGKIRMLPGTEIRALSGAPGDFTVTVGRGADTETLRVGAVVLASDLCDRPLTEAYGISGSQAVLSQAALEAALENPAASPALKDGRKITALFLLGFLQKGTPIVLSRVLSEIEALQKARSGNADVYVVAGDLKLAADGLDRLYAESRRNGAIFFKLESAPEITQTESAVTLHVYDQALRETLAICPDLLVVEDALAPSPENEALAAALRLDLDASGFLQKENVHLGPVLSNREGVFVVGPARALCDLSGGLLDAKNAALSVAALFSGEASANVARVDADKCTICLTCFRVCPHGAISWNGTAQISPLACRGCGLCASECPMEAIQVGGYEDEAISRKLSEAPAGEAAGPRITAFVCKNSAAEALGAAKAFRLPLPKNLSAVVVPCAGKVDADSILEALVNGADGVMVVSCHMGNCKSEKGNLYASWRVSDVKRRLSDIGLAPERVSFTTLAANMASGFSRAALEMETALKGLAGEKAQ
ncbi:MAG: hydrogenase iron-sulfur subunit [Thermodesulfobacteriota bacterium]